MTVRLGEGGRPYRRRVGEPTRSGRPGRGPTPTLRAGCVGPPWGGSRLEIGGLRMGQGTHDVAVPRTPDELTPAWLSAALGAEVTAVTATDIGAGSGLFGVVLRLELTHDGNAPDSLIAFLKTL